MPSSCEPGSDRTIVDGSSVGRESAHTWQVIYRDILAMSGAARKLVMAP